MKISVLLAVLAQVQALISEPMWRAISGILAILAILALWRDMRMQRIPKPHPLRIKVQKFICDLSATADLSEPLATAIELRDDFANLGLYSDYTPNLKNNIDISGSTLDRAAVSFQKMLEYLPY